MEAARDSVVEERELELQLLLHLLKRLEGRYTSDTQALKRIWQARDKVARTRASSLAQRPRGASTPDIGLALKLLDRIELLLLALDERRKELEGDPRSAPSRPAYLREFQKVRDLYLEAIGALLEGRAMELFDRAEQAAAALPRALLEVDLTRVASRPASYTLLEPSRQEMGEWVKWLRRKLDTLERQAREAGAARQRNGADAARHAHALRATTELIELSVEALGHWEQLLEAYAYLARGGNVIPAAYGSVGTLVARCREMKATAMAEKPEALRGQLHRHREDPAAAAFLRGLPMVVAGSRLLVGLGVTLVASVVTAGVGGVVSGAWGAARVGAGLSFAGTVAVESLTFTTVSRGLQGLIPGETAPSSWWADLAWNLGLFSAMRGFHLGTQALLQARGLPPLAEAAVHKTGSFGLLQAYGALHHRVSLGQWPTEEEWATMTAHNLILLMGLAVGLQATQSVLPRLGANSATARFSRAFASRFRALGDTRDKLEATYRELQGKENLSAGEVAALQSRAKQLEEAFHTLVKEVEADPRFNLQALREEGTRTGELAQEASSEVLAKLLGIGNGEDGLKQTAGPRAFSYAWGRTNNLEKRLRAQGVEVHKAAKNDTGLRVLEIRFGKEALLTLKERPSPYPASREVEFDKNAPEIRKLFEDFGISSPKIQRYIHGHIAKKLADNPAKGFLSTIKAMERAWRDIKTNTSIQEHFRRERHLGRIHTTAKPELIHAAAQLHAKGILTSKNWLDTRGLLEQKGLVGEWLARQSAIASATNGARVLANIRFKGRLFKDNAATQPYKERASGLIDVVPELDILVVKINRDGLQYAQLANVKITDPRSANKLRSDADNQNQLAFEALRAHYENRLAQVKTHSNQTLYAEIKEITGLDVITGKTIQLTGRITPSPEGVLQETILPKTHEHHRPWDLDFTHQDIVTITELLLERQHSQSAEY